MKNCKKNHFFIIFLVLIQVFWNLKEKNGNYLFFLNFRNVFYAKNSIKDSKKWWKSKKNPNFHIFLKIALKKIGININLTYKNEKSSKMVIFDKISKTNTFQVLKLNFWSTFKKYFFFLQKFFFSLALERAENVQIIQIHPYTAKLDVGHKNEWNFIKKKI